MALTCGFVGEKACVWVRVWAVEGGTHLRQQLEGRSQAVQCGDTDQPQPISAIVADGIPTCVIAADADVVDRLLRS